MTDNTHFTNSTTAEPLQVTHRYYILGDRVFKLTHHNGFPYALETINLETKEFYHDLSFMRVINNSDDLEKLTEIEFQSICKSFGYKLETLSA